MDEEDVNLNPTEIVEDKDPALRPQNLDEFIGQTTACLLRLLVKGGSLWTTFYFMDLQG